MGVRNTILLTRLGVKVYVEERLCGGWKIKGDDLRYHAASVQFSRRRYQSVYIMNEVLSKIGTVCSDAIVVNGHNELRRNEVMILVQT